MEAVAVIAGIAVSVLGLVPFKVAMKAIRKVDPSFALNMLGPFLLTVVVSLLILLAGMLACKLIAPEVVVVYSVAELVSFCVGILVMGVYIRRRLG